MKKSARLNIAKKAEKMHREQGMTFKRIAGKFDITPETLRNYRRELQEEKEKNTAKKSKNKIDEVIDDAEKKAEEAAGKVKKTKSAAQGKSKKTTENTSKKIKTPGRTQINYKKVIWWAAGAAVLTVVAFAVYKLFHVKQSVNKGENEKIRQNNSNFKTDMRFGRLT